MLSPETSRIVKDFTLDYLFNCTCNIIYREQKATKYNIQQIDETFTVESSGDEEDTFWTSVGIALGTRDFPCGVTPINVENIKSIDVSDEKLFYNIHLPWYFEEVDKYRILQGKKPLLTQGGAIHVITPTDRGIFEIEQLRSRSFNKSVVRVIVSQRQTL